MSGRPRALTDDEVLLIQEVKVHRAKLRREVAELTDRKLAEKFEVCSRTIYKIRSPDHISKPAKMAGLCVYPLSRTIRMEHAHSQGSRERAGELGSFCS